MEKASMEEKHIEEKTAEEVTMEEGVMEEKAAEETYTEEDVEKTKNTIKKEKKKRAGKIVNTIYWIFMWLWSVACIFAVAIVLDYFYCFLKDYQQVYDETRPKLMMDEIFVEFDEADIEWILENANAIDVSFFENDDVLKQYVSDYMKGKKVSYQTKAGEHMEERPVYVVMLDDTPFAVVRLEKKEESAEYGHPLWTLREIELFVSPKVNRYITAPENATVYVNNIRLSDKSVVEVNSENENSFYYESYSDLVTLPGYKTYYVEGLFEEPKVEVKNFLGELMEAEFEEESKTYCYDYGMSESVRQEVEEYLIQFTKDYAMYISNDLKNTGLDKYFPKNSQLLKGIKNNSRQWYDEHKKPEIMNEELKELVLYTENALSARVYLEQYMYVPFSGRIQKVVTDLKVYYVKIDGAWKVASIAFE